MSDKAPPKHIASVACFNADGLLLFGRRNDNGKFCLPGGHVEEGETPKKAAIRELSEEAGIDVDAVNLTHLGSQYLKDKNIHVHSYQTILSEPAPIPTSDNDPDEEFDNDDFYWFHPDSLPEEVVENLHNKKDCTLDLLGVAHSKDLNKADMAQTYRSIDGSTVIPHRSELARAAYDQKYYRGILAKLAHGEPQRLVRLGSVPVNQLEAIDPATLTDEPKLNLYYRMAKDGDPLPPIVVVRLGDKFRVHDGIHKVAGAIKAGLPTLQAWELIPHSMRKALRDEVETAKLNNPPDDRSLTASEALYHLMGGHKAGWEPHTLSHEGKQHWFLKNKHTKEVLDPTSTIHVTKVPYENGIPKSFLSAHPSTNALKVINAVLAQRRE